MSKDLPRSNRLARAATEFVVIFVGVILALAADRWIAAADERADAAFYREQLEADIREDSVRLESRIAEATRKADVALAVLREVAGEDAVQRDDLGRIAADFKTVPSFDALDYHRATWDEMVSSGRVSLVDDPDLRRALTAYYDDLEGFAETEIEWNVSLRQLEEQVTLSDEPMRHLVLWGAAFRNMGIELPEAPEGDGFSGAGPSAADFTALIDVLHQQPSMQRRLALARVIWSVARYAYSSRLERNAQLLSRLSASRQ